jgi:hypothetical protein
VTGGETRQTKAQSELLRYTRNMGSGTVTYVTQRNLLTKLLSIHGPRAREARISLLRWSLDMRWSLMRLSELARCPPGGCNLGRLLRASYFIRSPRYCPRLSVRVSCVVATHVGEAKEAIDMPRIFVRLRRHRWGCQTEDGRTRGERNVT